MYEDVGDNFTLNNNYRLANGDYKTFVRIGNMCFLSGRISVTNVNAWSHNIGKVSKYLPKATASGGGAFQTTAGVVESNIKTTVTPDGGVYATIKSSMAPLVINVSVFWQF